MAPAGGGVKGFYRQTKKRGGVAKPSTSSKGSKNKPPQHYTTQGPIGLLLLFSMLVAVLAYFLGTWKNITVHMATHPKQI
jgi:hypothetical protein